MLEQLLIFTKGGLVLWGSIGGAIKGSPIDTLIRSCLLEERGGDRSYKYDAAGASYTCKWSFHNDLGLVFVAVYQQFLQLMYVDELLSMVKREFAKVYNPKRSSYPDFDDVFRQLHREVQARSDELTRVKQQQNCVVAAPANGNTNKGQGERTSGKSSRKSGGGGTKIGSDQEDADGNDHGNGDVGNGHSNGNFKSSSDEEVQVSVVEKPSAFNINKLQKLKGKKDKNAKSAKADSKPKSRIKDVVPEKSLDFTKTKPDDAEVKVVKIEQKSLMDSDDDIVSDDEEDEEIEKVQGNGAPTKKKGWFSSVFQSVAGKASLEKTDLEPALKALKDRLMTKNVAEEIAEQLCESVAASLIGKKLGTFSRVSSTVKVAMEEALQRILTPKRSIDILRDINGAAEEGRPYVIVFVGVNGVGKSTNLAKVAYWLLQHEKKVMIAACDTFRSGAVEQLRTHASCLQVRLFEKGYEKDPSPVAAEAISEARKSKHDVVLVDTAGRMQDNEPLMAALARLISSNKPDLVLFVGEALVGNEAVDQLAKFNQKLSDKAARGSSDRVIDGILLTKFDTIDDKVGAALSMVYVSGAPIMFVGCGQSYTDLRKINVKSIIRTLLA